jgi:Fic family protein
MVNFLRKPEEKRLEGVEKQEINPQHVLVAGAGLEILRDLKNKVDQIQFKLSDLEKRIESLDQKVLTQEKFREEVQTSEDIAEKIISEVKGLAKRKSVIKVLEQNLTEEKPTLVEFKRIEKISELLEQHEKLSSSQLAQLMNLSRTRSNEYFKRMESLGLVEPMIIGKEKFYTLKS